MGPLISEVRLATAKDVLAVIESQIEAVLADAKLGTAERARRAATLCGIALRAIEAGELRIDPARRTVELAGEPVQLTYVEFELLRVLVSNRGRAFTRQELLEELWGGSEYRDPRTIDVHVRHLREKLEHDPKEPQLILTVRSVGYRFSEG